MIMERNPVLFNFSDNCTVFFDGLAFVQYNTSTPLYLSFAKFDNNIAPNLII